MDKSISILAHSEKGSISVLAKVRSFLLLIAINLCIFIILLILGIVGLETYWSWGEIRPGAGALVRGYELGWDSNPRLTQVSSAENGLRLAFIGDSFTQSGQWPAFTTDLLSKKGLSTFAVSMGVSGHGTIQTYLKLRQHIAEIKPDVVVLLFFAWNDMRDNYNFPSIYYNAQTRERPYFEPDGQSIVYPSLWFPDYVVNSHLYERLIIQRDIKRFDEVLEKKGLNWMAENRQALKMNYTATYSWENFYKPDHARDPYIRGAWNATEKALVRLNHLVKKNGGQLAVLGIDNAFTVDNDVYEEWIPDKAASKMETPLRRLGKILRRHNIFYTNCLPLLRDLSVNQHGKKVYNGPEGNLSGHLEPSADMVVAEAARDAILRLGGSKVRISE